MKKTYTYQSENDGRIRVDKLLSDLCPEYSRSALAKLFDLKLIKLNGEAIQPGFRLKSGAEIEYDLGPLQQVPEVIDLPVVYEDDDIIVVNKPAGIISHARGRFWQEASVASFIRNKVSRELKGERGGIVHRLDRVTSGVMICAKNEKTLLDLQKSFSGRKVQKKYIAAVHDKPKEDVFIIDAPIMRDPKHPKLFKVDSLGKPARTKVSVIHSNKKRSVLLLEPETGRTHQLRVHLAYINLPIIGDPLYGPDAKKYNEHSTSLRLHAHTLSIRVRGEMKTFTAPVPDYWYLDQEELSNVQKKIIGSLDEQ